MSLASILGRGTGFIREGIRNGIKLSSGPSKNTRSYRVQDVVARINDPVFAEAANAGLIRRMAGR